MRKLIGSVRIFCFGRLCPPFSCYLFVDFTYRIPFYPSFNFSILRYFPIQFFTFSNYIDVTLLIHFRFVLKSCGNCKIVCWCFVVSDCVCLLVCLAVCYVSPRCQEYKSTHNHCIYFLYIQWIQNCFYPNNKNKNWHTDFENVFWGTVCRYDEWLNMIMAACLARFCGWQCGWLNFDMHNVDSHRRALPQIVTRRWDGDGLEMP